MTEPAGTAPSQHRPAVLGRRGAISSSHYLASQAGMDVFRRGGTAIDAGVAAGIALNVVERHLTDLGGVAPTMVLRPGMEAPETIDGLGRWPAAPDLETYLSLYGGDMPEGLARAVVPAAVDAWLTTLARHGTRSLAEVVAPAVELAEGFPVHPRLAAAIAARAPVLAEWPSSAATFLASGRPPRPGEILVQDDLAGLLRSLVAAERAAAARGCDRVAAILAAREAFYTGEIASMIAAFVRREGGFITEEDLAAYGVSIAPSVSATYRGVGVHACGPWSQGPLVPMALNLLEAFEVAAWGPGSLEFFHHYTEAMKLACADREGFFGDPDFVDVPLAGLLHRGYAEQRRQAIGPSAHPGLPLPGDPWAFEERTGPAGGVPRVVQGPAGPDTTYVSALDSDGNAYSATPSDSGMASPLVPGLGIVVSDRGSQFWLEAGHPSALAPGKRPRLTPNPAMLVRDGWPLMAFGCPGGDAQCQAMVQVVCNLVDFGMNVQEAIEAPRVISWSFPNSFFPHGSRPGVLRVESRVPAGVRDGLAVRGHQVEVIGPYPEESAAVCAVRQLDVGVLEAGADPRRDSYALAW